MPGALNPMWCLRSQGRDDHKQEVLRELRVHFSFMGKRESGTVILQSSRCKTLFQLPHGVQRRGHVHCCCRV